jgi:hypothetical protein
VMTGSLFVLLPGRVERASVSMLDSACRSLSRKHSQCLVVDKKGEAMGKGLYRMIVLSLTCVGLAGCIGGTARKVPFFQGPRWPFWSPTQTVEGPDPLIEEYFEEIDLALLLDPSLSENTCNQSDPSRPSTFFGPYISCEQERLQKALEKFYERVQVSAEPQMLRNRVQDQILAASNQRCGQYKQFLKRFDAGTNLTLGWLTTGAAGAGAIFTAADTVRALSGVASILSGFRAETNETLFHRRTVQLLTDGFEAKRRAIYQQIVTNRTAKELTDYTVEHAIQDAVLYHDHCSLVAGLEYAALAVDRVDDPGLSHLQTALKTFGEAQKEAIRISNRSETGVAQEVVFPLLAFGEAEQAQKELKTAETDLKNAQIPSAVDAQQTKLYSDRQKNLLASIAGKLAQADKMLTPEKKKDVEDIENKIDAAWKQVFADRGDPKKFPTAKHDLEEQQNLAATIAEPYKSLAKALREKKDQAESLTIEINRLGK